MTQRIPESMIDPAVQLGGGLQSMQVFTSSGTWTKPAGVTKIKVTVIGGGGGGGHYHTPGSNGGGGGGGGCSIKFIDVSAISSETVTIGAGGLAAISGNSGSDGGTSSFGAHCTATGGTGGIYSGNSTKIISDGGSGSGGDLNFKGGPGEGRATQANNLTTGGGGGSFFGGGSAPNVSAQNGASPATASYGGGGTGAGSGGGTATPSAGGAGVILVEEFS